MNDTLYYPNPRVTPGSVWYVKSTGTRSGNGKSWATHKITVQDAVDAASAGDTIYVAPGSYDESVTVAYAKAGLSIVGVGGRGTVAIAPSTAHAEALIVHAANVVLQNLDLACPDVTTATSLTATGNGLRVVACKLEGGTNGVIYGPGTVATTGAHTAGHGGDARFTDCEFAWGTNGVVLQGTDYGAATQVVIEDCLFHNLTASSVKELVGSGGSATLTYRNLTIRNCVFEPAEDGTEPTKYITIAGDNANTGIVTGCKFTVASNSGKNLVSTACKWVGNFYVAGISAAAPS